MYLIKVSPPPSLPHSFLSSWARDCLCSPSLLLLRYIILHKKEEKSCAMCIIHVEIISFIANYTQFVFYSSLTTKSGSVSQSSSSSVLVIVLTSTPALHILSLPTTRGPALEDKQRKSWKEKRKLMSIKGRGLRSTRSGKIPEIRSITGI